MGDSITSGYGTAKPSTDAYPAVVSRWLGSRYQVRNFGVGGTGIINSGPHPYQKTNTFKEAVQFHPNILVVSLGTNDSGQVFSAQTRTEYERGYRTLIAAFKRNNPTLKIYTCLTTPAYSKEGVENMNIPTSILPLIRLIAQKEGAKVVDLYTPLRRYPQVFTDGVHPNTAGAHLIAVQVYRALISQ